MINIEKEECEKVKNCFENDFGVKVISINVQHDKKFNTFSNGKIFVCKNKYKQDVIDKLPEFYIGYEVLLVHC